MGLEKGNLKRLVHVEMHVDEFASKMGDDCDVCVVSLKVADREPAEDLANFIEKGYSWILDADVSSGEMDDGEYIVFIELDRDQHLCDRVMKIMTDVMNLTGQQLTDWRVRYHTSTKDHELSAESLRNLIPTSPEKYKAKYGHDDDDQQSGSGSDSDSDDTEPQDIHEQLDKLLSLIHISEPTRPY